MSSRNDDKKNQERMHAHVHYMKGEIKTHPTCHQQAKVQCGKFEKENVMNF